VNDSRPARTLPPHTDFVSTWQPSYMLANTCNVIVIDMFYTFWRLW
jgi:hypothetical protein